MEFSDNSDNETDRDDEDFDINEYREEMDSDASYQPFETSEGSDAGEYTGPILPGHDFDKKLLCIKYPGVVVNPEKAIETLGGIGAVSAANDVPNRRLELRFRPQDGYSKPICGDKHETAGFLLRIRIKKSRLREMEQAEIDNKNDLDFKGPYDMEKLEELLGDLGKGVFSDKKDDKNKKNVQQDTSSTKSGNDIEGSKDSSIESSKNTNKDMSSDENYQIPSAKILGRVETEFDFQNLCDFQYLAIGKSVTDPSKEEYIYESVYPCGIPPYRWLKNKVPYFLPPPAFSRMDSVQQFSLKAERNKGPENVIGKTRRRRAGFTNFINFNSPDTPSQPPAGIETAMRIKFFEKSYVEKMKQLFDERPVWSKNALSCITNFTNEQLKFLLPSVAYYFVTGPWRIMWVKLGYDPRKDPSSRKYQTLDYRLRAMRGLEYSVSRKRTTAEYTLPYKSAPGMKARRTILTSMVDDKTVRKKDQQVRETAYIYREGVVPPSRQMFYQYCDIKVPEIQEMLAKLPDQLPPGAKCHEKRGWLPSGFSDQCREILNRQVRSVLRKQMNIPEDHPTALKPQKHRKKISIRSTKIGSRNFTKSRAKKKAKKSEEKVQKDSEDKSS